MSYVVILRDTHPVEPENPKIYGPYEAEDFAEELAGELLESLPIELLDRWAVGVYPVHAPEVLLRVITANKAKVG